MSDKKKLLGDALRTRNVIAKPPIDIANAESIGKEVIAPSAPQPSAQASMQRTSFNFPADVYEAMLEHTFKQRMTMRDYLVKLIKKDLEV